MSCFCLVIVPIYISIACLGLHVGALLNLEESIAVEQRAQVAATKLAALTFSKQAMYDVVLSAG